VFIYLLFPSCILFGFVSFHWLNCSSTITCTHIRWCKCRLLPNGNLKTEIMKEVLSNAGKTCLTFKKSLGAKL
jgi:hypothetical protein